MRLSTRTQFFLLATLLLACAAIGPATMPIWRNAWTTNRPPMFVEGNNDLIVTNIPGKISYNFFVGSTNSIARKNDSSNDVAAVAGANITVTPSGAAGRMTYTIASTGGSGVSTNPTQFGVSSQLTLKDGAFQTNGNFWGIGFTNHTDFYNSGSIFIANKSALTDLGNLGVGLGFPGLATPNIFINAQDALIDIGGGILGVGTGLGAPFVQVNTPALLTVGTVPGALTDNAGNLEVGLNTAGGLVSFPATVNVGTETGAIFDSGGQLQIKDTVGLGLTLDSASGDVAIGQNAGTILLKNQTSADFQVFPTFDASVPLGNVGSRWSRLDVITITNYATVYIPTNNAPMKTIAPANLHSITIGKGWTNDLGARADMVISFSKSDAVGGNPALAFTNSVTGEAWTNTITGGIVITIQDTIVIPDISPNDRGSFTDVSTGAGSAMAIRTAWWKLK